MRVPFAVTVGMVALLAAGPASAFGPAAIIGALASAAMSAGAGAVLSGSGVGPAGQSRAAPAPEAGAVQPRADRVRRPARLSTRPSSARVKREARSNPVVTRTAKSRKVAGRHIAH